MQAGFAVKFLRRREGNRCCQSCIFGLECTITINNTHWRNHLQYYIIRCTSLYIEHAYSIKFIYYMIQQYLHYTYTYPPHTHRLTPTRRTPGLLRGETSCSASSCSPPSRGGPSCGVWPRPWRNRAGLKPISGNFNWDLWGKIWWNMGKYGNFKPIIYGNLWGKYGKIMMSHELIVLFRLYGKLVLLFWLRWESDLVQVFEARVLGLFSQNSLRPVFFSNRGKDSSAVFSVVVRCALCKAKQGSKSPVKELEEKLSKALGRKIKKGDMLWTYQAQLSLLAFSCIESWNPALLPAGLCRLLLRLHPARLQWSCHVWAISHHPWWEDVSPLMLQTVMSAWGPICKRGSIVLSGKDLGSSRGLAWKCSSLFRVHLTQEVSV